MITINNKKFAENDKEFIDSLFQHGGTCCGYAKKLKRSVKLFDMQHNLIAVLNKFGVLCKATLLDNGKYWYSYAAIPLLGEMSLSQKIKDLESIAVDYSTSGFERTYQYK